MLFPGVIPAVTTPFDSSDAVDTAALARTAQRLVDAGMTGLVGCGTMGEASALSREERQTVLATLVEAVDGRVPITAGISADTPAKSAAYATDAASAGARALMCLPPLGYEADAREVLAFYSAVAEATDLPIMAYNNPKAAGQDIPPSLLAQLADDVPAIVAIKECSGDARRIAGLIELAGERLEVLVGGDDWALEGFAAGATGWVSGVASIAANECRELHELVVAGDLEAARALYVRLLPLARLDMKTKLVQYFKAAQDGAGFDGGPSRPPRLPLTDAEQSEVDAALRTLAGDRVAA